MLVLGHRGCMGDERLPPENSLAAFRYALDHGADGVELDVHVTSDGEVVAFHDRSLERMTGQVGLVEQQTFAYLRSLELCATGVYIPLLTEVLDLVEGYLQQGRTLVVNIELKADGTAEPVCALIARYLARPLWSYDCFVVSSFDFSFLRFVHRQNAEIRIGALFERHPFYSVEGIVRELGFVPYSIHPLMHVVDISYVKEAHSQGIRIFSWESKGVSDSSKPLELSEEKMRAFGFDGVIVNDVSLFGKSGLLSD